jgi:GR25 family glycosyltransferase involved in LPS biosynthesis
MPLIRKKLHHKSHIHSTKLTYVLKNNCPLHKKVNWIDHIVWINLESSNNRFKLMNALLNSLTIPHTRIEAIDGKDANFIHKCLSSDTKMTPLEIACTFSHLKAIQALKSIPGEFFMVCEDDISFENLRFFDITLHDIIKNAPYFDILLIYHSFPSELSEEYTNWSIHGQWSNNQNLIAGAAAYIIRKTSVQSFPNFNINLIPKDLDCADRYMYKRLVTIVYKYNFVTITCNNSTIHENHLWMHKKWKENHLHIIQKNLAVMNRKYQSCNIFFEWNASKYQNILKNFSNYKLVLKKSDADIIIYHEEDDVFFEYNQKYNILIKTSHQTYQHPYNCILNTDSKLVISKDYYLSHTNWLIVN